MFKVLSLSLYKIHMRMHSSILGCFARYFLKRCFTFGVVIQSIGVASTRDISGLFYCNLSDVSFYSPNKCVYKHQYSDLTFHKPNYSHRVKINCIFINEHTNNM